MPPSTKPGIIHTDNFPEFSRTCDELGWTHETSTPHHSEANGIAERAVRRVTEGTASVLVQSEFTDRGHWRDNHWCEGGPRRQPAPSHTTAAKRHVTSRDVSAP